MKRPRRRKSKTPRAKAIKLNEMFWLKNSKAIEQFRKSELLAQEGRCAITGVPLDEDTRVPVLDHAHAASAGNNVDGKCRAVLLSEANTLEGKYLKLFQRMKMDDKYNLDFPTFLINMGEYLQQDNSENPYHFKYMTDFRDYIKRLNKTTILAWLKRDFNVESDISETHPELVRQYVQLWVDLVEKKESERASKD